MDIILLVFLAYRIALTAKRKGQNAVKWAILTVVAFLFCEIIGGGIVLAYFYKGNLTQGDVAGYLMTHPIHTIFMWFSGLGGYLFIRYRLDKIPEKKPDDDLPQF